MGYTSHVTPAEWKRTCDSLRAMDQAIVPFVIPIYGVTPDETVTAIGSGVLLRYRNRYVMVTAGHVLDHAACSQLVTWNRPGEGFLPIRGNGITTEPWGTLRGSDRIDLAIVLLERETVRALKQTAMRFAPVDMLASVDHPEGIYTFAGYPVDSNEPVVQLDATGRVTTDIVKTLHSLYVREAPATAYARVGCDPELHFVGILNHRNLVRSDGSSQAPPHPVGLSGGGLFFYGSYAAIHGGYSRPRLAGIGIEYHPDQYLIIACGMRALTDGLARVFARR